MSTWGGRPKLGAWRNDGNRPQQRERKDNELVLFVNDRKESEKHPDFRGQGLVNGVEVWASLWVRQSKKDNSEYFSVSLTPKDAARRDNTQRQQSSPPPRPAPSRFQRAAQPQRNEEPAFEDQGFGNDWEREP